MHGQSSAGFAADRSHSPKERALPGGFPSKASQPPLWSVPVEPLGFSPPGPLYLGERNSLASLDFIDEDRLLFSFRVPGLIHRDLKAGQNGNGEERQIRAVVFSLPEGAVQSEALWTVHDRARYIWMLEDGHFLFRDGDDLQQGDAHLELKPVLHFPGPLVWLELDPTQQFLVSNSLEPAVAPAGAPAGAPAASTSRLGEISGPAAAVLTQDGPDAAGSSTAQSDMVVRILHRETGQVMLVSRVRSTVHLPINSEGYIESLRGRGQQWILNLNFFSGGSRILGSVDSSCAPTPDFLSEHELLVTACDGSGGHRLVAITTEGRTLWDDLNPATAIWPLLIRSPNGLRLAQETLAVNRPVTAYAPLGSDDIKGQVVRVIDAATGDMAFESQLSPVLDAGGNVAISPSGRRVAVLDAGAIQVFELPPPPPLPSPTAKPQVP